MRRSSFYALAGFSIAVALGACSGGGGGCGGLAALPADPQPTGFPRDQQIEGGIQARVTKPGFDKLSSLIPVLAKQALAKPMCFGKQQQNLGLGSVSECDDNCNGGTGCPITITLRPDLAPPGGISISMPDGSNPIIHIDAAFDVHMPMKIRYKLLIGGWNDLCTMDVDSNGTHINADIQLGIDA